MKYFGLTKERSFDGFTDANNLKAYEDVENLPEEKTKILNRFPSKEELEEKSFKCDSCSRILQLEKHYGKKQLANTRPRVSSKIFQRKSYKRTTFHIFPRFYVKMENSS